MVTEDEVKTIRTPVRFYIVIPACDKCCRDEDSYDNRLNLDADLRRVYTTAGLAMDPSIFEGFSTESLSVHLNGVMANFLADPMKYVMLLNKFRDDTYDSVLTELTEFIVKLDKYSTSTVQVAV